MPFRHQANDAYMQRLNLQVPTAKGIKKIAKVDKCLLKGVNPVFVDLEDLKYEQY